MSRSRYRLRRAPALLAMGIFVIATGTILIATASQTTTVIVNQDLSEYWRTAYDILVRPPAHDCRGQRRRRQAFILQIT